METKEETRKLRELAEKVVSVFKPRAGVGRATNLALLSNVYLTLCLVPLDVFAVAYFARAKLASCIYTLAASVGAFVGVATLLRFSAGLQVTMLAVATIAATIGALSWALKTAIARMLLIARLREEIVGAGVFAAPGDGFLTIDGESFSLAADRMNRHIAGLVTVLLVNLLAVVTSCGVSVCMLIEQKRAHDRVAGIESRRQRYNRLKSLKSDLVDPKRIT